MKKFHAPYSTTKPHSKVEIGQTHETKHEKKSHEKHQSLGKQDDDLFGMGTLPEEYE